MGSNQNPEGTIMLVRKPVFPNVIEVNHQLGQVLGCNVYIVYDDDKWIMIDVGYQDTVGEVVQLIRELDLPFSGCQTLIATHADVDHVQGLAQIKSILRCAVSAHELAAIPLRQGDRIKTFALIEAQGIDLAMPPVEIEHLLNDGDTIELGNLKLEVWLTPGHTDSQLVFRMGELLFSGDNIYRDGSVGAIDAHHGSDLVAFIKSLERIRNCDVKWLLPSHGPIFRKDNALIDAAIRRLEGYLYLADFGTCAVAWPMMDDFENEIVAGKMPLGNQD
jgi:glyoxylase-like metal-dependent hydrolase (beta-lactamase superfamily II)